MTATDSDGTPDAGSSSVTVTVGPTLPTVWIDAPTAGSTVSGTVAVAGWAIDNTSAVGTAISTVEVKVDGTVVGFATYGLSRPDVCAVYPGRPGCPNVGYSFSLDTSSLSPGSHIINVTATDSDGTPDSGSASVTVTVQTTPPTVWIDAPASGATVSGIVTIAGWAMDNACCGGDRHQQRAGQGGWDGRGHCDLRAQPSGCVCQLIQAGPGVLTWVIRFP